MKLKSSTLLRGQKQLQMRFLIKFVVQLVDVFNLDANDETLMACTVDFKNRPDDDEGKSMLVGIASKGMSILQQ